MILNYFSWSGKNFIFWYNKGPILKDITKNQYIRTRYIFYYSSSDPVYLFWYLFVLLIIIIIFCIFQYTQIYFCTTIYYHLVCSQIIIWDRLYKKLLNFGSAQSLNFKKNITKLILKTRGFHITLNNLSTSIYSFLLYDITFNLKLDL